MNRQITRHLMMIRPANFGFNEETAINNAFQQREGMEDTDRIRKDAIREFDTFVQILNVNGIDVTIIQDTDTPVKPDAVFCNNWISFHDDGTLITYPMFSALRRNERDEDIIRQLEEKFVVNRRYSFEHYEEKNMFLESTGSIVFDRMNKIAYACISPRTDIRLLDKWCVLTGYSQESFDAIDQNGDQIYHTNVLMAMGETFVVICMDAVQNNAQKKSLLQRFMNTNKAVIEISYDQMKQFAGNMLQVANDRGEKLVVMSDQAFSSLNKEQIIEIQKHANILRSPLFTIEKYGGGSARCMMAEVFLPLKK